MRHRSFASVISLVATYAVISVGTVGVLAALHAQPAQATDTAWVRGVVVALASLASLGLAVAMSRGSRGAWLRLRILSAVMLVAIVAFLAIPGSLPPWMKVEQAVCGVLLLAVAVVVNGRGARHAFASAQARV